MGTFGTSDVVYISTNVLAGGDPCGVYTNLVRDREESLSGTSQLNQS